MDAALVGRMKQRLAEFALTVQHFSALGEKTVEETGWGVGPIRWWRWEGAPRGKIGWDLLRTSDGFWLGWPVGQVAYPPLFAQVFPRSRAEIITAIDAFGGFVVPPQLDYATTLEKALCQSKAPTPPGDSHAR